MSNLKIISSGEFELCVARMAGKFQKSPEEIRKLLTPEALAGVGYRRETLVEQVQREGVHARENMVIENLRAKGLI